MLSDGQIVSALAELPGWQLTGETLVRTITSETFPEAIALVGKVAEIAESKNHHPDIDIRWRKVTYSLTTHSAGGITALDLDLAAEIDSLTRE